LPGSASGTRLPCVNAALEQILNLLLESERAGVVAIGEAARDAKPDDLRRFLLEAQAEEARNVANLESLIRDAGGTVSSRTGPFAEKMAALKTLGERLNLLSRGQEWVARKVEEALAIAPPSGPIREFLEKMANRHRHEVEWERAEVIRLLGPQS
jgi:Domain of unknown function (DUF6306)